MKKNFSCSPVRFPKCCCFPSSQQDAKRGLHKPQNATKSRVLVLMTLKCMSVQLKRGHKSNLDQNLWNNVLGTDESKTELFGQQNRRHLGIFNIPVRLDVLELK
ncbi:hypothetical protein ILYODFUR_021377 [Ilyodon furcidens]|uniref:Uncharacterized protein n=1 Tax=Ilyodon furcidens TaxID=33524 RepID=A0ABV0TKG2_9TELE